MKTRVLFRSLSIAITVALASIAEQAKAQTNGTYTIPLYPYQLEGNPPAQRLAIYVGVNGGKPRPYLFDTGSAVLEAVIGNGPYNPSTHVNGVTNLSTNFGYSYGSGNGFSGTLVQTKVSLYAGPTATKPIVTFTSAANSSNGIIVNAISDHWIGTSSYPTDQYTNQPFALRDTNFWAAVRINKLPNIANKELIFGAAPFVQNGANVYLPTAVNPNIAYQDGGQPLPNNLTYGSVIGQVATNGYIVDAASSNKTLTINYSVQTYAPFTNNLHPGNVTTNVAMAKFPNSGTPTIGFNGGNEVKIDNVTLAGTNNSINSFTNVSLPSTPPEGLLLDSGNPHFQYQIDSMFNTDAEIFVNQDSDFLNPGNLFSIDVQGSQILSFITSTNYNPKQVQVTTNSNVLGIGLFLQDRVLFDLTNQMIGFDPVPPHYDHIVVVILENHGYSELLSAGTNLPFINGVLRSGGADMVKSYSLQHPSQPNYYWLFSGSNQGIVDDSAPSPTHLFSASNNLCSELAGIGKTFYGYVDAYPGATNLYAGGYKVTNGNIGSDTNDTDTIEFVTRHVPWLGFSNLSASVTHDFNEFNSTNDFSNLPDVAFVIPSLENDMHCTPDGENVSNVVSSLIAETNSDNWLSANLSAYAQWAVSNNSLLILTTDEESTADWPTPPPTNPASFNSYNFAGSTNPVVAGLTAPTAAFSPGGLNPGKNGAVQSGSNQITTIFYGAHVMPGDYTEGAGITHVNVLRTVEWLCGITNGVGAQSGAVKTIKATPVTDIFYH